MRRLRSFSTPQFLIDRFVFCCILPHILYCSPVVFCGLLSKDRKIITRCLKLIAKCSGISLTRLQEFVISKHLSSCELFASKILSDVQHPLHLILSNSRLSRPRRTSYKHIYPRTNAYKNSVIPYLNKQARRSWRNIFLYPFLNALHFLSYFIAFLHLISHTCVFWIVSVPENLYSDK